MLLAQGNRPYAWAASTCWWSCLSLVPCSSWPPGLASHFTGASCKASRPWDKGPNMASSLMSRPYELHTARGSCTQTLFYCQFVSLFDNWIIEDLWLSISLTSSLEGNCSAACCARTLILQSAFRRGSHTTHGFVYSKKWTVGWKSKKINKTCLTFILRYRPIFIFEP